MADKKISQLTALSAANVASATDVLAIVDTSATETKKITAKDLIDGALNGGTANGVLYLNGSKVATSGSALQFSGTKLSLSAAGGADFVGVFTNTTAATPYILRIQEPATPTSGYPLLDVVNNAGSTAYLRVDSGTGNVGIGTASPSAKLHVTGSAAGAYGAVIYNTSATGEGLTVRGGSTSSQNALVVQTSSGGDLFNVRSDGNVGIGTSSPTRRLSLNEAASTQVWTGYLQNNSEKMVVGLDASGNGNFLVTANAPAIFSTNNTERARITSGGYSKFSNDGTYVGSASSYHEFRQTNNEITLILSATNASLTSSGQRIRITRAASNAFEAMLIETDGGGNNLYNLRGDGNAYADGTWNNNGADYAEYFESSTGGALTVGATVVLEGNKVREATASDPVSAIMGVVRPKEPGKASMVVGNTAWNKWANKYLTDDFDRYIMEDHDVVEWTDEDGRQHSYESHNIPADITAPADAVRKTHDEKGNKFQHYKLNPAWDKDAEYTPREKRDEWIIVGLVGQVKVLKGKPVNDRWIKMRDVSAAVEEWMIR